MAKIIRHKDKTTGIESNINLESGDVDQQSPEAWPVSLSNSFVRVCDLVEQINERQINLVDETNIVSISHALVPFGDKGKNLFDQICIHQTIFNTDDIESTWTTALRRSKAKTANAFIKLCKSKGLDSSEIERQWEYKLKEPGKSSIDITEEISEDQAKKIQEFSFYEHDNCYYFATYNYDSHVCNLERRSNFIIKILFHITRGKSNKRLIELINIHNRKVSIDVDTNQLASFQKFKELTEGAGNFIFEGTNIDLLRIKNKLFQEEKPSFQIDMLGWDSKEKFFSFSNGIYDKIFHPVDEHGTVQLKEKNFFIPYHPGTDNYLHINEKKFTYKESNTSFEQWSRLYCHAFGDAGKVALLFGIATLFSDHIFSVRGNFPLLFLYGEGGSGKSRVAMYLQHLWGDPQPPLKLSEKANTDKGKIRKMAQYVNTLAVFEEFINELDNSVIKTITGIYDRFGYERSNIDSKYGTETVPINSSALITGNVYPNDDPLMQRLILMDYNTNIKDDKVVNAYDELTILNRSGITSITGILLQHRDTIEDSFETEFREQFKSFKDKLKGNNLVMPDRMCENYSMIISMYTVLQKAGLMLPFSFESLLVFLIDTIRVQNEKRDTGSATQRFWDIVLQLASEGIIKHNKEYILRDDHLIIRWKEIHNMYMEKHLRIHRSPGLSNASLMQKLKDSDAWREYKDSVRLPGLKNPTSGHVFYYSKLGIDLWSVVEYWESQTGSSYSNLQNGTYFGKQNGHVPYTSLQNESQPLQMDKNPIVGNKGGNDDLPF